MKKYLLLLYLISFVSCGNSNQSTQVKEETVIEGVELLRKEAYTPKIVAVSIFTVNPVDAKQAGAIFRKYDEPGKTITVFFHDDKINVTDDNYYAYTDGSCLYFKGQLQGVKIE